MTTFSKEEMKKASKTIRNSIKKGKGLPISVTMKSQKGQNIKLSKKQYNGLFEAQNVFIRKNGRYPNYVTLNTTANNPLVIDYQDNPYSCCPTSFSMGIMMLYDYIPESKCAKVLGTVKGSGTSPSDLLANAPKLGYKVSVIKRNYDAVKKCLDKGFPVISHIQTKNAKCLGFTNDYGHYGLIYGCKDGNYLYADPTKGLKVCKASQIDKATNGRDIHYYKVQIL